MMTEELRKRIEEMVKGHHVVLFMKGSPHMPMCGFSASTVETLRAAGATEVVAYDVLKDPDVRQGLKEYSNWPTIPQVFVDGQFVGGCDIVREMHERGELAPLVAAK